MKQSELDRERLVKQLKNRGYISSQMLEKAMLFIPREKFIPENLRSFAYLDNPLEIGEGQTISAPSMIAIMCEALDLKPKLKVLEVGAGSGYHAALVARMVGDEGQVYSIERIARLADFARKNLEKAGIKNVTVVEGDGSLGLPQHAPFDRFYVTCAAPRVPSHLVEQLVDGGRGLVPVGKYLSELTSVIKKRGKVIQKNLGGCVFVPLIGMDGFEE
jgi:protein-L-isoaspartate(D-aspartate) O-methyltransferase